MDFKENSPLYQGCPNYLGSRAKNGALNWPKEPTLEFVKEPVKEPILVYFYCMSTYEYVDTVVQV